MFFLIYLWLPISVVKPTNFNVNNNKGLNKSIIQQIWLLSYLSHLPVRLTPGLKFNLIKRH